MAPPWIVYAGRVEALFAADPKVRVDRSGLEVDGPRRKLVLRVEGAAKACAIASLLPTSVEYGNVALAIDVVPANAEPTEADVFREAFAGNPVFEGMAEGWGPAGDIAYALFAPEAVQLREDDASEFGGLATLTWAELAESVLKRGDVLVSSAIRGDVISGSVIRGDILASSATKA